MILAADADCYYGDHYWVGGQCSNCYEQLRCYCGRFVKVGDLDRHLRENCPTAARWATEDDGEAGQ